MSKSNIILVKNVNVLSLAADTSSWWADLEIVINHKYE
jgi:hypothetical protein